MISPAIHFSGNCKQALTFYEKVFNATDKNVALYRDAPSDSGFIVTDDTKNYVMHASMTIRGTRFYFSDIQDKTLPGNMICFNVFFKTADEVICTFDKLKEGGNVLVELDSQFFSEMYGVVLDKFGVRWQLIVGN
ncbi:VOC family protein [Clostridiaceae bacterium M8S5]|nr:VOC family protein [Clostridiaceae bacterium M8S5]